MNEARAIEGVRFRSPAIGAQTRARAHLSPRTADPKAHEGEERLGGGEEQRRGRGHEKRG
jgi:hypothetical protein